MPFMAEAAEELKRYSHIDIGMHATLTSEWDGIRWGAMTEAMRKSDYTYEDGSFFILKKRLWMLAQKLKWCWLSMMLN